MTGFEYLALFIAALGGALFDNAVGVIFGFAVVRTVEVVYKRRKFGGWNVVITKPDGTDIIRPIGIRKAEEILDDISTMSVFLKGLVSGYGTLKIDLVIEGPLVGVLTINKSNKKFILNLTNPEYFDPHKKRTL